MRVNADNPSTVGSMNVQNITIVAAPNPGLSSSVTQCASLGPFNMFNALGGTPDPGGTWVAPGSTPHSNTFTPGVDLQGMYSYVVLGIAPCPNVTSTLAITILACMVTPGDLLLPDQ